MEFKFRCISILATLKVFSQHIQFLVSILSFLHYLLQDLIFNGIQIDFVHQQLFWRRRIAIRRIDALQS